MQIDNLLKISYNPQCVQNENIAMTKKKPLYITQENIDALARTKKVQDIEYRVVCTKDIVTGEEEINIAPSKNTLHEDVIQEVYCRNPRARDMAGRVLLYDIGAEPMVYFSAVDGWGIMDVYWDWDERVIPHLEPKIKQVFKEMKAEGKTATLSVDRNRKRDRNFWDNLYNRMEELDKQFAGRDLMKKVEDYAPQSIQEEQIKERSLKKLKREEDLERAESVRARQDSKHARDKVFLWKQACREDY